MNLNFATCNSWGGGRTGRGGTGEVERGAGYLFRHRVYASITGGFFDGLVQKRRAIRGDDKKWSHSLKATPS